MQKLSAMKCYRINQVPEHLNKIDDLYEEYKSTVKEQRLKFEQSMLSKYLIKSLPDSYYLPVKQSFCGKAQKDKEWLNMMTTAREVHDDQVALLKAKKKATGRQGTALKNTPSLSTS